MFFLHATKCNFVSQEKSYDTFSDTALSPSPLITHLSAYSSWPIVFYNNYWFFINFSFKFSYSLSYQTETVVINAFHRKLFVVASFVVNASGIWNCRCSPCLNKYLTYTIIQRSHILCFHYKFSAQTALRNQDSITVHLFTCIVIGSMVPGFCLEVTMKI